MNRLWGWVAAAGSILIAALLLVIGQRDKARQKTKDARVSLQASEATRDAEQATRKAQAQARDKTTEVQREADDRPDDHRPSGDLRR